MDVVWPNRLRALREAREAPQGRKLLIEDVAAAVDRSIGYIARLERGLQRPDRQLLEALAGYYDVDPDSIETGTAKVEMTDAKIVGAWMRVLRKRKRLSIERLARDLKLKVSMSQVRLVEAGQRVFVPGDTLLEAIAEALGAGSSAQMLEDARAALKAGTLDEALKELHPHHHSLLSEPRAFVMGRRDQPVELPDYVRQRMLDGEVAYLIDRNLPGGVVAKGSYCIVNPDAPLAPGLIFNGAVIREMRAQKPSGAFSSERPGGTSELVNVLAIVASSVSNS